MHSKYTIGLDYGTNSVRSSLSIPPTDASRYVVWNYSTASGLILSRDPPGRQHPAYYIKHRGQHPARAGGGEKESAGLQAGSKSWGIGVDTTAARRCRSMSVANRWL